MIEPRSIQCILACLPDPCICLALDLAAAVMRPGSPCVLAGRIAGTLPFHPPQVDDFAHAGKVARITIDDEVRQMDEWLANCAGPGAAPRNTPLPAPSV